MPGPLSATTMRAVPAPVRETVQRMRPGEGVNLYAFPSRLVRTRSIFAGSTSASSWAGTSSVRESPRPTPTDSNCDATRRTSAARSTRCAWRAVACASNRATSSRSLTRSSSTQALRSTISSSLFASAATASLPRSARTGPRMRVRGVRSSWLTFAKKRLLISSCRRRSSRAASTERNWRNDSRRKRSPRCELATLMMPVASRK